MNTEMEDARVDIHRMTEGACRRLPGPCPHTMCRHHMSDAPSDYLNRGRGPSREPAPASACVFDVAVQGQTMTLEQVATQIGLTRERVRQIEGIALRRAKRAGLRLAGDVP